MCTDSKTSNNNLLQLHTQQVCVRFDSAENSPLNAHLNWAAQLLAKLLDELFGLRSSVWRDF